MGLFTTAAALLLGGGLTAISANKQVKEQKKEAANITQQNAAAIQSVKDAQVNAPIKAQDTLNIKRRAISGSSQSIFTSPLGLSGQASIAKKTLLGQ